MPFLLDPNRVGPGGELGDQGTDNPNLFDDPYRQPTFLTVSRVNVFNDEVTVVLTIRPLSLVFEQSASVTGCAWYGSGPNPFGLGQLKVEAADGLSAAEVDQFFIDEYRSEFDSNSDTADFVSGLKLALRTSGSPSNDSDALDILISQCFQNFPELIALPASQQDNLDRLGGGVPVCEFEKNGSVQNCAVGGMIPIVEAEVLSRAVVTSAQEVSRCRFVVCG